MLLPLSVYAETASESKPLAAISSVIYSTDLRANLVRRSIPVAYITYFSINSEHFTISFNGYLLFLDP